MPVSSCYFFSFMVIQEDPKVLKKCLIIAHKLYSKLKIQKLGPVLLTLLDTLVWYGVHVSVVLLQIDVCRCCPVFRMKNQL